MQNRKIKILLLGSFFLLSLAPIGIETNIFWNNLESLKDFFNFFRLVIPVVIFTILSLFFIKQLQIKILFNNFFIFFYFVIIFITTLINLENFKEIDKLLLPLYCINYIFLSLLVLNINDIKKEFNKFIFYSF